MQYELRIDEAELTVTATSAEGRVSLAVGETVFEGALAVAEGNRVLLQGGNGPREAGAPREAWVARGAEGLWTWCDGRVRLVQDAGARRAQRRGAGAGAAKDVTPLMPAVVTNLLCAEGDRVKKGQGLVVVSAMKMEMTLAAPFAGTVSAVRTQVGAKVNPGEILVDIAPEAPEAHDAPDANSAREGDGPRAPEDRHA